jgi:hypothetical protein
VRLLKPFLAGGLPSPILIVRMSHNVTEYERPMQSKTMASITDNCLLRRPISPQEDR